MDERSDGIRSLFRQIALNGGAGIKIDTRHLQPVLAIVDNVVRE